MSNPSTRLDPPGWSDAELVSRAVGGDRDAFAAIYDRYGDRVYTTCVHMLRDPHDGADCAADVFLLAAERLHQLRDPSRLKPWLFAIARHEVYRRTKRRTREIPTDDMTDTPMIDEETTTDPDVARRLVADAAQGLDERDQLVLSLTLAGGLEGDDLASALGTSTSTAHVVAHRMRERLAVSVGALLVAQGGRQDCAELRTVLHGWDGTFSVLVRKRVARHIDQCDICDKRRQRMPVAMLSLGPALAAPAGLRDRILGEVSLVSHTGKPWRSDGFPPRPAREWRSTDPGRARRRAGFVAAAALLLAGIGGTWWAVHTDHDGDVSTLERANSSAITTTIDAAEGGPPDSEPPLSAFPAPTDTASGPPTTDAVPPTVEETDGSEPPSSPSTVVVTLPPIPPQSPTTTAPRGPVLIASPNSLDLGTTQRSATVTVTNAGDRDASITPGSTTAWLSVNTTAFTLAPGASTAVTMTANRGAAPEGNLTASIEFVASGASPLSVPTRVNTNAGPSIQLTAAPAQFSVAGPCSVSATVSDQSVVSSVVIEYSTPNGTAQAALSARRSSWSGPVAVGGPPRTVTWRVVATDALGNQTRSADRTSPAASFCS